MPHDFSKCTSNVCLSGNLGFNNGKSPEKCIFAAGACLPKQSPYHWVEIRGRFVDGEWSSHFPKHFGKLTLGLCLQGCLKVCRRKGRGGWFSNLLVLTNPLLTRSGEDPSGNQTKENRRNLCSAGSVPLIWLMMQPHQCHCKLKGGGENR